MFKYQVQYQEEKEALGAAVGTLYPAECWIANMQDAGTMLHMMSRQCVLLQPF